MKCSTSALKSVLHLKKTPMGAALSFLGQKLFASSTLINAKCENISCCTSVAAVQPLKKRMTTIYVDSRKRVADLVPQKSSRSLGIFKEQDHRHCDDQEDSRVHRTGLFSYGQKKEPNFAMKLALGLDVQTNAKGGKFMSIEDSHQGALVRKVDVEVLWEPGNFQDDGAKRVGVCFASNTNLELWTEEVRASSTT